jgi:hypothetical protein
MTKKLQYILSVCLMTFSLLAQAQQQVWYLNNQSVDFRSGLPLVTQGLPGSPGASIYESRNGVHDQNGDLLFYLDGAHIMNKQGNAIGNLLSFGFPHAELAIVAVPGASCKYYVIYQHTSKFTPPCPPFNGNRYNLAYTIVDMSLNNGQGGTITPSIQELDSCNYVTGSAIAVGKPKNNNTQYLYEVGLNSVAFDILKYTISSTGISTPTTIYSSNYDPSFVRPAEMDLSYAEDKLVFTTGGNDIHIVHLDVNGNLDASTGNQGGGYTKHTISGQTLSGVEFSTQDNNLFVGQINTGILVVNPNTGSFTSLGTASASYGNSQLETAYHPGGLNKIYAVDGNKFGEISAINGTPIFTPNAIGGASYNFMQDLNSSTYQLVDQIDGFDYSASSGVAYDLYIKDSNNDLGAEPNTTTQFPWLSDDIWVRNQQDGLTTHENPEFQAGQKVYVYVRVRNMGCSASDDTDEIKLYWSKASTSLAWPIHWNGSLDLDPPNLLSAGEIIGTKSISPTINPGGDEIIEFEWIPPNPSEYNGIVAEPWHFCLLARIETANDPMYIVEGTNLGANVLNNNNIAWKNLTVVDNIPGIVEDPTAECSSLFEGIGAAVAVSNPFNNDETFNLTFEVPAKESTGPITQEGTIMISLSNQLYSKWVQGGREGNGFKEIKYPEKYSNETSITLTNKGSTVAIANRHLFEITGRTTIFENILLSANEGSSTSLMILYPENPVSDKDTFQYDIIQKVARTGEAIGGVRYDINKVDCTSFKADAGLDQNITQGGNANLKIQTALKCANQFWLDENGTVLATNDDMKVSPNKTTIYTLKSISAEGCISEDQVTINVNQLEEFEPSISVGFDTGITVPTGCLASLDKNSGLSLEIDLEYQFAPYFSIEARGGHYQFEGNNNINGGSLSLRGNLAQKKIHPFSSLGVGAYDDSDNNISFGIVTALGLKFSVIGNLQIETSANFFTIFEKNYESTYLTFGAGLKQKF